MDKDSPFLAFKQVEIQVKTVLREVDAELLDQSARKLVSEMKRLTTDTRLDIRDYELSETRQEQLAKASAAHRGIKQLERHILAISMHNIFGAVEVAQLDAWLEKIREQVR